MILGTSEDSCWNLHLLDRLNNVPRGRRNLFPGPETVKYLYYVRTNHDVSTPKDKRGRHRCSGPDVVSVGSSLPLPPPRLPSSLSRRDTTEETNRVFHTSSLFLYVRSIRLGRRWRWVGRVSFTMKDRRKHFIFCVRGPTGRRRNLVRCTYGCTSRSFESEPVQISLLLAGSLLYPHLHLR